MADKCRVLRKLKERKKGKEVVSTRCYYKCEKVTCGDDDETKGNRCVYVVTFDEDESEVLSVDCECMKRPKTWEKHGSDTFTCVAWQSDLGKAEIQKGNKKISVRKRAFECRSEKTACKDDKECVLQITFPKTNTSGKFEEISCSCEEWSKL